MAEDKRARLKQWLESGEAKLYPATLTQRELWEAAPVPPGDVSNHICTVTTVKGPVSREYCEKAMALVVEKQEVMRLSILPGKNGPVQLVRKKRNASLYLRALEPDECSGEALDAVIVDLIRTPLDIVGGPLYRLHILRLSEEEHILVLVIHHAIADGWTLGVFMTDLWTAYAQLILGVPGALEPVPQTYTEWGATQRAIWSEQEIRSRSPFWKARLSGSQRLFEAPTMAPESPGRRARWFTEMPIEVFEELRGVASRQGATLFSTALTVFQIVMAKVTGKTDILVGSPVAGRNRRSSHETMGSYAGVVPLRGLVDPASTVAEQLTATHGMTVDCFAHALPFVELVKCLDAPVVPGTNPIFDVRFALQNHPMPDVSMPGMEVSYRTRSTGTARHDLACELTEIGSIMEVVWLYREDMFSAAGVERFHQLFATALTEICRDPATPVADLLDRLT